VARPQQVGDSPEDEIAQFAEGVFGHRVFEVVGPSSQDLTELETPLFNRTWGEAVSVGEWRTPPIVGRAGVNQT
jgi:hypothetical protein